MEETNVVFGTDSTLTSSWNAWEHFRQALSHVSEEELLAMLTTKPALLWGMNDRGTLRAGAAADLVILGYDREIFDNNPSSILGVMRSGRFVALDEALPGAAFLTRQLYPVQVGDRRKWVQGDLPGLISSIQQFFPFDNPLQHA
jgi:adenine deaminase